VLDSLGRTVIGKAGSEALDQPDRPIGGTEQQGTGAASEVIAPPSNAAIT